MGNLLAVLALLLFSVWSVSLRRVRGQLRSASPKGILLWALTGLLTISAQISVIAATAYSPVAIVLVISSALPIVVIPVSLFVLRSAEGIRVATVVGAGVVLVGVAGILLR